MSNLEKYNIVTLSNEKSYVICEDLIKNNKKYLLLVLTDEDENIYAEDSKVVKIVEMSDGKLHISDLDNSFDDNEACKQIIRKFYDNTK